MMNITARYYRSASDETYEAFAIDENASHRTPRLIARQEHFVCSFPPLCWRRDALFGDRKMRIPSKFRRSA